MRLLTSPQLQVPSVGAIAFAHNRQRRLTQRTRFTWSSVSTSSGSPLTFSENLVTSFPNSNGGAIAQPSISRETYVEFSLSSGTLSAWIVYGLRLAGGAQPFNIPNAVGVYGYYQDGAVWMNQVKQNSYGPVLSGSSIVGMLFNPTTGSLRFHVNGVWRNTLSIPGAPNSYQPFLYSREASATYRLASLPQELVYPSDV